MYIFDLFKLKFILFWIIIVYLHILASRYMCVYSAALGEFWCSWPVLRPCLRAHAVVTFQHESHVSLSLSLSVSLIAVHLFITCQQKVTVFLKPQVFLNILSLLSLWAASCCLALQTWFWYRQIQLPVLIHNMRPSYIACLINPYMIHQSILMKKGLHL